MLKLNISRVFSWRLKEEYAVVATEFDKEYYLDNNKDVKAAHIDPCQHYVKFGWKESRDPTPWFDTGEYLRQNRDVREKGINPFYHYLKFGRAENRPVFAPMPRATLEPVIDLEGMAKAAQFSVDAYAQWTGRGPFSTLAEALNDAIGRGSVPVESLQGGPDASAELLLEFGNACRARGLQQQAQSFYQLAHEQDPALFHPIHQLGDCFLDFKDFSTAVHFYKMALGINDQYFWTHANLAKALFELTRYEEAIRHARIARELDPGSVFGDRLLRSLHHQWGHRLIESGFAAARKRDYSRCRDLMTEAAAKGPARPAHAEPPGPRDASRPLRVVMLADDALPQCLLYRVTNKVYQLETQNASVEWFPKANVRQFEDALAFADAAIFYRVPATPEIVDAIRYARSIGKPTFYDLDDLIFRSEHYPESYESYANLISWEQYAGLIGGTELFRLAMRECDFGMASTAPLAEYMKKEVLSGDVIVVPNSLGPSHRRKSPAKNGNGSPKRTVEIFHGSGTLAHKQDFETFATEVLAPLLDKHPHARLTLIGKFASLAALSRFGSRVKRLTTNWKFEQYLRQLETTDINLAVVNPSPFNDCKSEIKWLEAGLLGIPSVLSRTETHRLTVEDGKTGFLCERPEEWLTALDRLVSDADLRHAVGRAAQEVVTTKYAAATVGARMFEQISARAGPVTTKRKLRVAIVHVFYPPQAIGGATRVVQENVDSLRARYGDEIDIEVFTTKDGGDSPGSIERYVHNGVPVTALTIAPDPKAEWRPKDEAVRKVFARYLDFTKPDIVHFHCVQRLTGSVVDAARDAGIPYLVTVHDGWWLSDHQFLVDAKGKLYVGDALSIEGMKLAGIQQPSIDRTLYLRSLLADAKAVLAVSESFAQIYRDVGLTNVKAVENGTTRLDPIARDEKAGAKVRLGFIGGLAIHKGYGLLRQVWSTNKFKHLELVLIDHAQPEMKVQRGAWNGNPITVLGRVRQDRIVELYASLDMLLAISIWPESYGLVTREAAQAGLWIVASDRGAVGDVVEDGRNGFRIDVSDSVALERVLLDIDQAPEKYRSRTNYPVSLRSFDEQVDELVEIYRNIGQRGADGGRQTVGIEAVQSATPAAPDAVSASAPELGPRARSRMTAGTG